MKLWINMCLCGKGAGLLGSLVGFDILGLLGGGLLKSYRPESRMNSYFQQLRVVAPEYRLWYSAIPADVGFVQSSLREFTTVRTH